MKFCIAPAGSLQIESVSGVILDDERGDALGADLSQLWERPELSCEDAADARRPPRGLASRGVGGRSGEYARDPLRRVRNGVELRRRGRRRATGAAAHAQRALSLAIRLDAGSRYLANRLDAGSRFLPRRLDRPNPFS